MLFSWNQQSRSEEKCLFWETEKLIKSFKKKKLLVKSLFSDYKPHISSSKPLIVTIRGMKQN